MSASRGIVDAVVTAEAFRDVCGAMETNPKDAPPQGFYPIDSQKKPIREAAEAIS